jgi:hypothetical protein
MSHERLEWFGNRGVERPSESGDDPNSRKPVHGTYSKALMVELEVAEGKLTMHVQGADKLWAFKSSLEIPLVHIAGIRADPEIAHGWWHGVRLPGTNLPGVITAGTFYQDGKRVFWDVHNPANTVVITLRDERYDELVVEVANPQEALKMIQDAL